MNELNALPAYYTVQQLAERWELSERVVQKWLSQGVFPNAYKTGLGRSSRYRVPAADVIAFEEARKIKHS